MKIQTFETDLRSREFTTRIWWFINMRWFAVALCFVGGFMIKFNVIPVKIDSVYMFYVGIFLILTNIAYSKIGTMFNTGIIDKKKIRIVLIMQVVTDYIGLSFVTYACGTVETPIQILFLPHILLMTLFFRRSISFAITVIGVFFCSLPIVLEREGVVPMVNILGSSYKETIYTNLLFTTIIIIALTGSFFVCWYLVSAISCSLMKRENELENAHLTMVNLNNEKAKASVRGTHELKAPLAAIKTYINTLKSGYCGKLPEKAEKVIGKMGDRCDRLMEKIIDIIHLSNLKNLLVFENYFSKVDLNKILDLEIKEALLRGKSKNIVIRNSVEDNLPLYIKASKDHIHTVLSNLLQNAITYSYENSTVDVSAKEDGNNIVLSVKDKGIGISKDTIPKIFDEYYRTSDAVNFNPVGNGLGLSIVKEILNIHNAAIDVVSNNGQGTEFKVTFDKYLKKGSSNGKNIISR